MNRNYQVEMKIYKWEIISLTISKKILLELEFSQEKSTNAKYIIWLRKKYRLDNIIILNIH